MEAPLSAREFLERFHLPQLVRISSPVQVDDDADGEDVDNVVVQGANEQQEANECEFAGDQQSGHSSASDGDNKNHDNQATIHLSQAKRQSRREDQQQPQQHEKSNWTYRPVRSNATEHHQAASGFRSLGLANGTSQPGEFSEEDNEGDEDEDEDQHRFRSVSAWSSVEVNRMLERRVAADRTQQQQHDCVLATVRMPRVSLATVQQQQQQQNQQQQQQRRARGNVAKKSVEFEASAARSESGGAQLATGSSHGGGGGGGVETSIRLAPPSKRPSQSKLHLDQPFLLYKAYKKLELCAYVIDQKNELNEKSGDPIYFPSEYPGWFTIRPKSLDNSHQAIGLQQQLSNSHHQNRPLETIDEVCRSGAQIFLTRDELVAYQLPSKLSHLTKLKNNQLLALPLAINLAGDTRSGSSSQKLSAAGESGSAKESGGRSSGASNISDIRHVVVQSGQTLKICGVYEDVLPLIEQGRLPDPPPPLPIVHHHPPVAAGPQFNHLLDQQQQAHHSIVPYQVAPQQQQQASQLYHGQQMAEQQLYQQVMTQNGYPLEQKTRKLLKLRYTAGGSGAVAAADYHKLQRQPAALPQQGYYGAAAMPAPQSQLIYAGNQHQHLLLSAPPPPKPVAAARWKPTKLGRGQKQQPAVQVTAAAAGRLAKQPVAVGQRYARCLLLSQRSVDRLTDPLARNEQHAEENQSHRECYNEGSDNEEIEVLIPIDQRGRFYLCATDQSIFNELYCCCASSANRSSASLVFRLSQIVSLLSLSKRLQPQANNSNKDTTTGGCGGDGPEQQQRHSQQPQRDGPTQGAQSIQQGQCRVRTIKLPLNVQLVIGPRPANFSPSMFNGSSSTMESYFCSEANVGGHSIECKYNRNFVAAASSSADPTTTTTSAPTSSAATTSFNGRPVCSCALRLAKAELGSSESYGVFSAALRIEHVTKRDVLLACSIKQDPLVHLSIGDQFDALATKKSSGQQQHLDELAQRRRRSQTNHPATLAAGGNRAADLLRLEQQLRSSDSRGLISLRESGSGAELTRVRDKIGAGQATNESPAPPTTTRLASMGGTKSSFSRLRACRSLISLNGRRKRRPNIPSSMMIAQSGGGRLALSSCDSSPLGGASASQRHTQRRTRGGEDATTGGGGAHETTAPIVILEFDCNDTGPRFVRTFVESSIPTSSIPDLVLNRMEFCQRNSHDWERQLKLSYRTLAQDFDSFQRQMEQNKRQSEAAAAAAMVAASASVASPPASQAMHHQKQTQQQQHRHHHHKHTAAHLPALLAAGAGSGAGAAPFASDDLSTTTASSSRSSSGVSSAGDRGDKRLSAAGSQQQRRQPGKTSSASNNDASEPTTMSSSSASSTSLTATNSSRLLRFVNKILPTPFSSSSSSGKSNASGVAAAEQPAGAYALGRAIGDAIDDDDHVDEPQRRVMAELDEKFKRELALSSGGSDSANKGAAAAAARAQPHLSLRQPEEPRPNDATLMNAQKIHRKLMTGAARHLVSDSPDSGEKGQNEKSAAKMAEKGYGELPIEEIDFVRRHEQHEHGDDSSSHLYESLERLNERRGARLAAADRRANKLGEGGGVNRCKLGLGRSIEFLVGGSGRMSALVSQSSSRWRDAGWRQDNGNDQDDDDDEDDDYEEEEASDDDDDEWWCSSTRESTGESRFRVVRSLAGLQEQQRQKQQQQQQQQRQLQQQQQQRRRRHTKEGGGATTRRAESSDGCAMEPVSIEACHDEFVSTVCADEDDDDDDGDEAQGRRRRYQSTASELSYPSSASCRSERTAAHCSRSLIDQVGQRDGDDAGAGETDAVYVNLISGRQSRSSFDLDRRARSRHLAAAGRMERKLMKLRGRPGYQQQRQSSLSAAAASEGVWSARTGGGGGGSNLGSPVRARCESPSSSCSESPSSSLLPEAAAATAAKRDRAPPSSPPPPAEPAEWALVATGEAYRGAGRSKSGPIGRPEGQKQKQSVATGSHSAESVNSFASTDFQPAPPPLPRRFDLRAAAACATAVGLDDDPRDGASIKSQPPTAHVNSSRRLSSSFGSASSSASSASSRTTLSAASSLSRGPVSLTATGAPLGGGGGGGHSSSADSCSSSFAAVAERTSRSMDWAAGELCAASTKQQQQQQRQQIPFKFRHHVGRVTASVASNKAASQLAGAEPPPSQQQRSQRRQQTNGRSAHVKKTGGCLLQLDDNSSSVGQQQRPATRLATLDRTQTTATRHQQQQHYHHHQHHRL